MSFYDAKYNMRAREGDLYRTPDPAVRSPDARSSQMGYRKAMSNYHDMHNRYMQWLMSGRGPYSTDDRMGQMPSPGFKRRPLTQQTQRSQPSRANSVPPASPIRPGSQIRLSGNCDDNYCSPFINKDRYNPNHQMEAISRMSSPGRITQAERDCGSSMAYKSDLIVGDDPETARRQDYRDDMGGSLRTLMCTPESMAGGFRPHDRNDGGTLLTNKKFSLMGTEQEGFMKPEDHRAARGTVHECLIWKPHIKSQDPRPPREPLPKAVGPHVRTNSYCLHRMRSILSSLDQSSCITSPSQLDDHLYIGSLNDAVDHRKLRRLKISYIFDCAANESYATAYPSSSGVVAYESIPAEDTCAHDMLQYVDKALAFIDMVKRRNGKVLVHCMKGINRSAFICCAYMMLRCNKNVFQAVKRVKHARGIVLTNPGFQQQLVDLAKVHNRIN